MADKDATASQIDAAKKAGNDAVDIAYRAIDNDAKKALAATQLIRRQSRMKPQLLKPKWLWISCWIQLTSWFLCNN